MNKAGAKKTAKSAGNKRRTRGKNRKRNRSAQTTLEEEQQGSVAEDNRPTVCENQDDEPPPNKAPSDPVLSAFLDRLEKTNLEALRKEYNELKNYVPPLSDSTSFEANRMRNRYSDQICYEHTRVKLTYNVPPDTDYIHANWVNVEDVGHNMICTQGPLPDTVNDFWRMIYQEKVAAIVMLCKTVEGGKPKCAQYYAPTAGDTQLVGTLTVRTVLISTADKAYDQVTLEVGKTSVPFSGEHALRLYMWKDWPDKYVPSSGMGVIRLVRAVRQLLKSKLPSPVVIHCSAGVGRTGTVAALAVIMAKIMEKKTFAVYDVVRDLRARRFNAVQTEVQYFYIHRAICDYIQVKGFKRPVLDQFYSEFNNYLKTMTPQG